MTQVNGTIKFVNSDAKGDSLVLEDNTRIYLGKGEGKKFFGKKGAILTGEAEQKTSKAGNIYLVSSASKLKAEGGTGSSRSSSSDFNTRAARGQALNLAMQIAIAEGKAHDHDYVLSLIPNLLKLSESVQSLEDPSTLEKDNSVNADVF